MLPNGCSFCTVICGNTYCPYKEKGMKENRQTSGEYMTEQEMKLKHAEYIIGLIKKLDFRRACIESRVYLGETTKKHSEFYKEGGTEQ
jgi:hypothetical protein